MTFKTIPIKNCKTATDVHIFLDRNDNSEDFVRLLCWHYTDDGFIIQSAEADVFKRSNGEYNSLMMRRYIADFSEISANEFANSMTF